MCLFVVVVFVCFLFRDFELIGWIYHSLWPWLLMAAYDPISKLQVILLASKWGFSKGGFSSINREMAIQLAKFSEIEVTLFLPTGKCSDMDKQEAARHGISICEAAKLSAYNELDWLIIPPKDLRIDVVVGHGVKLGRQAQFICQSHKCKWVQVVHSDPGEIGNFRGREDLIDLCKIADFVVAVGPKLTKAFSDFLSYFKKAVFGFTPGVFTDFPTYQRAHDNRERCNVLVFGHGDDKDFELEDFDVVGRSVVGLHYTHLVFIGANEERIKGHFTKLGFPSNRLTVKPYQEDQEYLRRLFFETDLMLMPSKTEGFGVIVLQAMSAGLPVIVSKNSGFGEALSRIHFGSMYFIDSDDTSNWTMAIKSVWNKDRKLRLEEIKMVRDNYQKEYSWSQQCKCLIEGMVKLCDGMNYM